MSDRSVAADTARHYLKEFPDMATTTVARMAYAENRELWPSLESCRSMFRYYRNEWPHRTKHPGKDAIVEEAVRTPEEKREANGWRRLPESHAEEYTEFCLPLACNHILLLSDIHFPYHDLRALEAALQYGKEQGVNCIVLNGDILDFYAISRFIKDPRRVGVATELEMVRQFLELLRDEFRCPIYFKQGNHEERWEIYLKTKAPELLNVHEFRLDVLLRLPEYGAHYIDGKRIIRAGELAILHGHEFAASVFSPVNPARGYYLRSKRTMIAGHNHQSSEHNEKDLSGKVTTCWSTGCLCGLNPEYMPLNKWNHGFAVIKVRESGQFEVDNLRIIDGKIR